MSDPQIREMLLELICRADYDLYKSILYPPQEDEHENEELLRDLVAIVRKHTAQ